MHEMLGADGHDVTTAPSGEIDRFDFNQSVILVITELNTQSGALVNRARHEGHAASFRHTRLVQFLCANYERLSKVLRNARWGGWHRILNATLIIQVAGYIPRVSKVNPNQFAVTVCSVDGQR